MYSHFIKNGDLVFDVGANIGNRITPFLDLGANVVAIEPQKECVEYLRYKFGKAITIIPKGLGARTEHRTMYISRISTVSSFSKEWIASVKASRFSGVEWPTSEEIEITTLDLLITKYGLPVFVKIDVEGFELEVFKGLSVPLPHLSFEYTVPELTVQLKEILTYLHQLSSNSLFNYSVGESMELELDKDMTFEDFISFVETHEFSKTEFGDIYVKSSFT